MEEQSRHLQDLLYRRQHGDDGPCCDLGGAGASDTNFIDENIDQVERLSRCVNDSVVSIERKLGKIDEDKVSNADQKLLADKIDARFEILEARLGKITPSVEAAMNVDKKLAKVAQDLMPSIVDAVASCDKATSIKEIVEKAAGKFGDSLQQS
eukprot:698250-Karenia_brevis.AAC.1